LVSLLAALGLDARAEGSHRSDPETDMTSRERVVYERLLQRLYSVNRTLGDKLVHLHGRKTELEDVLKQVRGCLRVGLWRQSF
jgi:hypothetical protein